jgi:hypothetical protein
VLIIAKVCNNDQEQLKAAFPKISVDVVEPDSPQKKIENVSSLSAEIGFSNSNRKQSAAEEEKDEP